MNQDEQNQIENESLQPCANAEVIDNEVKKVARHIGRINIRN